MTKVPEEFLICHFTGGITRLSKGLNQRLAVREIPLSPCRMNAKQSPANISYGKIFLGKAVREMHHHIWQHMALGVILPIQDSPVQFPEAQKL